MFFHSDSFLLTLLDPCSTSLVTYSIIMRLDSICDILDVYNYVVVSQCLQVSVVSLHSQLMQIDRCCIFFIFFHFGLRTDGYNISNCRLFLLLKKCCHCHKNSCFIYINETYFLGIYCFGEKTNTHVTFSLVHTLNIALLCMYTVSVWIHTKIYSVKF